MIPGILLGILMFVLAPSDSQTTEKNVGKFFDLHIFTGPVGLLALTGILSNLAFVTFTSAMPLWLVNNHKLPSDSTLIGWTLSVFSLSAALGGIAGGLISNRVGVKRLIVTSTLLALVPLYGMFSLEPGSSLYFVAVILAGALVNAGMPLFVNAQDLSPENKATASGMLMGFSAGASGLIYIGIGRLQELIGLIPAMRVAYLALIGAAVLVTFAIKTRKQLEEAPVDHLTCLCSPCIDQNVSAYPHRAGTD
jgi:FSR family fosmidomycin resistance protein-like MFS transporter